jgi:hypothetical protein
MFLVTGPVTIRTSGMARRRDEAQAETLEIVERVLQRMNLQLAAIA